MLGALATCATRPRRSHEKQPRRFSRISGKGNPVRHRSGPAAVIPARTPRNVRPGPGMKLRFVPPPQRHWHRVPPAPGRRAGRGKARRPGRSASCRHGHADARNGLKKIHGTRRAPGDVTDVPPRRALPRAARRRAPLARGFPSASRPGAIAHAPTYSQARRSRGDLVRGPGGPCHQQGPEGQRHQGSPAGQTPGAAGGGQTRRRGHARAGAGAGPCPARADGSPPVRRGRAVHHLPRKAPRNAQPERGLP
ncbi:hypothetical protein DSECCO2_578000 [anaerobic digester metagenome]